MEGMFHHPQHLSHQKNTLLLSIKLVKLIGIIMSWLMKLYEISSQHKWVAYFIPNKTLNNLSNTVDG